MPDVTIAKTSYIKPIDGLTIEMQQDNKKKAVTLLMDLIKKKGKNPEDYVVRDVLPYTDLGVGSTDVWTYTYVKATTEEDYISHTMADDRFLVVYGYANASPSPKTLYFKLKRGTVALALVDVETIHLQQTPMGYIEPEGWMEGEKITMVLYGSAAEADKVIPLCLLAEPKDATIVAA